MCFYLVRFILFKGNLYRVFFNADSFLDVSSSLSECVVINKRQRNESSQSIQ